MDVGSNPTGSTKIIFFHIRGRVVEGTGLIIHFRKNSTGSNPVGCILLKKENYNLAFSLVDFPVNFRIKYNFARRTFEDCFLTIETIFGELIKKTCSIPIP